MSNYKNTILFALSIFILLTGTTHAAINKCKGEQVSISWRSDNVANVACRYTATNDSFIANSSDGKDPTQQNTTGTGALFTAEASGKIKLECTIPAGGTQPSSDTLTIKPASVCCVGNSSTVPGQGLGVGKSCANYCPANAPIWFPSS